MEFAPGYDGETQKVVDEFLDTLSLQCKKDCTTLEHVCGMGIWIDDTDATHVEALALVWRQDYDPEGDEEDMVNADRNCTFLRSSDHQIVHCNLREIGGSYIVSEDSEDGPYYKTYFFGSPS